MPVADQLPCPTNWTWVPSVIYYRWCLLAMVLPADLMTVPRDRMTTPKFLFTARRLTWLDQWASRVKKQDRRHTDVAVQAQVPPNQRKRSVRNISGLQWKRCGERVNTPRKMNMEPDGMDLQGRLFSSTTQWVNINAGTYSIYPEATLDLNQLLHILVRSISP